MSVAVSDIKPLGVYPRAVMDSRVVAIDFTDEPDFAVTPITSAVVTVDPPATVTVTASADVTTTPNYAKFRVSGGTAGTQCKVTVMATNGVDTITRSILVRTGNP